MKSDRTTKLTKNLFIRTYTGIEFQILEVNKSEVLAYRFDTKQVVNLIDTLLFEVIDVPTLGKPLTESEIKQKLHTYHITAKRVKPIREPIHKPNANIKNERLKLRV